MAGTVTADRLEADSASQLVIENGIALTPPTIADVNNVEIGRFCRAWVNFNGTGTPAVRASFNVSSITDTGTGQYGINFINAMPDANYSLSGNVNGWDAFAGLPNGLYSLGINTLTAGTANVWPIGTNGGGNNTAFYINDVTIVSLAFFR